MATSSLLSAQQRKKTGHGSGAIIGLRGGLVWGWAQSSVPGSGRAVVEFQVDGVVIGCALADIYDKELQERFGGDGCYGFAYPIPSYLLATGGRLTARLANTTIPLANSLLLQPASANMTQGDFNIQSRINTLPTYRLSGWVWNPREPSTPQQVFFYEGSQQIGRCLANEPTPELIDRGLDEGRFGFIFTLPPGLRDGKGHSLRVVVQGQTLAELEVIGLPEHSEQMIDRLQKYPVLAEDSELKGALLAYRTEREILRNVLPRSLGFEYYSAWRSAWGGATEAAECHADLAVGGNRCLVLMTGTGDRDSTLASLHRQTHVDCRILIASSSNAEEWHEQLNSFSGWVVVLAAGDRLKEDALIRMIESASYLHDVVYCDSDGPSTSDLAERQPWCKPQWDPLYHFASGHASGLMLFHASMLEGITLTGDPLDIPSGVLAAVQRSGRILHLPEILVEHQVWPRAPDPARESVCQALNAWLPGCSLQPKGKYNQVIPPTLSVWPTVSLIVPTRDRLDLLKPCIESLLASDYPALQIVVVDNDSCEKPTQRYLRQLQKRPECSVVSVPGPFNYADINNRAVLAASGEIVGLVNNDIEAFDAQWLKWMVRHLMLPQTVAVGAKLLWPNGMVQHGGVICGLNGVAGHVGNQWFADDDGYFGVNQLSRRVSAVTAACLLVRKADYLAVGGLDAANFQVNFNDVDFCLRLQQRGGQIAWVADAILTHHESASRGSDRQIPQKAARAQRETGKLLARWSNKLFNDPYYNPNLNLDLLPYSALATPPRQRIVRVAASGGFPDLDIAKS